MRKKFKFGDKLRFRNKNYLFYGVLNEPKAKFGPKKHYILFRKVKHSSIKVVESKIKIIHHFFIEIEYANPALVKRGWKR